MKVWLVRDFGLNALFLFFFFNLQVKKRFNDDVPLLDPVKDMKIGEPAFKEIVKKIDAFEKRLAEHRLHGNPNLPRLMSTCGKKDQVIKELEEARTQMKKATSLLQMADLRCMKRVLRRLGYCTQADVIEVKGNILF